jgi:hypothetical protein
LLPTGRMTQRTSALEIRGNSEEEVLRKAAEHWMESIPPDVLARVRASIHDEKKRLAKGTSPDWVSHYSINEKGCLHGGPISFPVGGAHRRFRLSSVSQISFPDSPYLTFRTATPPFLRPLHWNGSGFRTRKCLELPSLRSYSRSVRTRFVHRLTHRRR